MQKLKCVALGCMLLALGGCHRAVMVSPAEQVLQQSLVEESVVDSPKRTTADPRKWVEYRCKGKKIVKIQALSEKKNHKASIWLTFNDIRHTLSASLTRNGTKYSNIRWTWQERFNGIATLTDNSGKILAEKCKKVG